MAQALHVKQAEAELCSDTNMGCQRVCPLLMGCSGPVLHQSKDVCRLLIKVPGAISVRPGCCSCLLCPGLLVRLDHIGGMWQP